MRCPIVVACVDKTFLGLDFEYPDHTLHTHGKLLHALFTMHHTLVHDPTIDGIALLKYRCKELVGSLVTMLYLLD